MFGFVKCSAAKPQSAEDTFFLALSHLICSDDARWPQCPRLTGRQGSPEGQGREELPASSPRSSSQPGHEKVFKGVSSYPLHLKAIHIILL